MFWKLKVFPRPPSRTLPVDSSWLGHAKLRPRNQALLGLTDGWVAIGTGQAQVSTPVQWGSVPGAWEEITVTPEIAQLLECKDHSPGQLLSAVFIHEERAGQTRGAPRAQR